MTLAEKVVAAGIRYAALTDHQRIDGLAPFATVFARHGGVAISGVEICARHLDREIHLLAYGFDPGNGALVEMLRGTPLVAESIRVVHAAGGVVVLAHPFIISRDLAVLDEFVAGLCALGLDGIEAIYSSHSDDERRDLLALADRRDLLVSAGSDFHGPFSSGARAPGIEIEERRWKRFRAALPAFRKASAAGVVTPSAPPDFSAPVSRWFLIHILLPSLLAIALFVAVLFGAVLPSIENDLMTSKREMIRELTNSAWSILAAYDMDVRAGRLSLDAAQTRAREEIRRIRYGPEEKDYFWITDTGPRMVMHPWRADLEGEDLSDFRDPNGVALFAEFVRLAEAQDHGYVDYVWQWKDDPERLVPKASYVRIYRPWGWVIGTGIYIEDVEREIEAITRRMVDFSAGIAIVIGLILAYVIRQSYRLERRRRHVESDLRASHARYHLLVEASTEGTLMVVESRCNYANRTFLTMTGYSEKELSLLDLNDLFPSMGDENNDLSGKLGSATVPSRFSAMLRRKDGRVAPVLVTTTRVEVYGKGGWILVLKEEGGVPPPAHRPCEAEEAETVATAPAPERLRPLVDSLLAAGVETREITRVITGVSEAMTGRLLGKRIEEFGPPPVPFAFLAFGSEARKERTLFSDQDNGIVYEDPPAAETVRAVEYFRRLGIAICDDLDRAGYPYCKGESMARNPRWCCALSEWKKHFTSWIREPNPDEILRFNIFFDWRLIHGDPRLGDALGRHIDGLIEEAPTFFFHLAANALYYKEPLDLFGRIATDDPTGESGWVDLKKALLPVVNFARLYALRHRLAPMNTLDRFRALTTAGIMDEETRSGIAEAYEFIMRLRLGHQAALSFGIEEQEKNRISLADLDATARTGLKEAIARLATLQWRIEQDYPGAEKAGE